MFEAGTGFFHPMNHDDIGGGVQDNADQAEQNELHRHVLGRIDKLRNERQEKRRGFRIQGFDDNPIAKSAPRAGACNIDPPFAPRFPDRLAAEPHQIGGP